jgi:isopentenyl phosphate kinase
MMIVKLGGSVITRKDRYRSFRRATTRRLVREIAESGEQVVLVHGAGSFGHLVAAEHKLHLGHKNEKQVPALARVMLDVRDLNLRVLKELEDALLPAISIPPASCARMSGGKLVALDTKLFREYVEMGAMPVTFGDVVLDEQIGFSICSGDQLIDRLAKEFKPSRVIFCADVDGVYNADPKKHPDARLLQTVGEDSLRLLKNETSYTDVTGGMVGKLRNMMRMADLGAEIMVINGFAEGRLLATLKGERVIASRVVRRRG